MAGSGKPDFLFLPECHSPWTTCCFLLPWPDAFPSSLSVSLGCREIEAQSVPGSHVSPHLWTSGPRHSLPPCPEAYPQLCSLPNGKPYAPVMHSSTSSKGTVWEAHPGHVSFVPGCLPIFFFNLFHLSELHLKI